MGCNCGKPKCNGKCGCKSPAVLQINNPAEYITFHKVVIPASLGDSKTYPPRNGMYRNVLTFYEADQTSWLYSTDGIPTKLTNGITNYEDAVNLPQINGNTLIGDKAGEELGLQNKLTAGENIQISDENIISATDTTYTAGNGLNLTGTEFSADTTVLATKTEVAPKLQTEVVAELPTTGKESKLYLTPKDYTTGTATGNPITISLGEDAGQITSAQLDGDTYQQSYTGKNIFTAGNFDFTNGGIRSIGTNGVINLSGTLSQSWGFNIYGGKNLIPSGIIPAGTYTVSINQTVVFPFVLGLVAEDNTTTIDNYTIPAGSTSYTFTTDQPAKCFTLWSNYANHSGEQITVTDLTIMIESGSSATPYEPFCGGFPSPNPDYPQQIQTVTGTQTVSINGTDYPISLGSIELCKLGDYQDYIYKDGSDWKVHKATGEVTLTGAENWQYPDVGSTATFFQLSNNNWDAAFGAETHPIGTGGNEVQPTSAFKADKFVSIVGSDTNMRLNQGVGKRGTWFRIALLNTLGISTIDQFKTWLNANNVEVAYALATPTDTTITDSTLIAQLEAIRTATLQASNTITNTATGSNLAGDLELGYYEYDPQNRYDKWLWLDLNNNYEKLGS